MILPGPHFQREISRHFYAVIAPEIRDRFAYRSIDHFKPDPSVILPGTRVVILTFSTRDTALLWRV
jgi:hypothetical protein